MTDATTVRAVVTDADGTVRLDEVALDPIGPDQVRVRLAAAGVCHSDLSARDGVMRWPAPMVLGHEAAGIVTAVGDDVTRVGVGDRVALSWVQPCHACSACRKGQPQLCERSGPDAWERPYGTLDGARIDSFLGVGAFAEETTVVERACVPLPPDTPMDIAALVSCGITTGWGAVARSARVAPGQSVAVIGCGGVGLAAIQTARQIGARPIIAVDLQPARLELAARLGATDVVNAADGDPVKAIRTLTDGGADAIIEAVGKSVTITQAVKATRRGGTTVVAGVGSRDDVVEFSAMELYWMSRTIVGCVFGGVDPLRDMETVMGHALNGRIDVASMITGRVGLEEVPAALDALARGEGLRTVVEFPGWEDVERRLQPRDLPIAPL